MGLRNYELNNNIFYKREKICLNDKKEKVYVVGNLIVMGRRKR
jgi:hypothetical protein